MSAATKTPAPAQSVATPQGAQWAHSPFTGEQRRFHTGEAIPIGWSAGRAAKATGGQMNPNLFCFGTGGTDPHEIKLTVPEKDRAAFDALPHRSRKSILVTNITGTTYRVRRHPCSLGCYCAALAEPVANSN